MALRDELGLQIRQHYLEQTAQDPRPRYVLMATHWLSASSGPTFHDAARYLADKMHCTVVTTCFAPLDQLEKVADRFPVQGPDEGKVATLLIEDT